MPAAPRVLAGHVTRRRLPTGAGAIGALGLLPARGGGSTGTSAPGAAAGAGAGPFPLTVEHGNGTTEIPSAPQRVVTVGFSDQDPVLAMGVRPVAVTDWYGEHPYATWPWAQDELGDAQPVVLNRGAFTGTPDYRYEEIAALGPDLIVGLYTAMDGTQYRTLSRIAPTDQRSQVVTALGFVIPPEIGELAGDQDGATISDEQMGLLDRDVLLWNTGFSPEVRTDVEAAPLYSQLAVVQAGRSVFVEDPLVAAAWTWGTVLSLPTVIDALVGQLAAVMA